MITIFDLDDTLYPEHTYVESGFRAVARWGEAQFGWPASDSLESMCRLLAEHGRGKVFDLWLQAGGLRPTRRLVGSAVRVYRHHEPDIHMPQDHHAVLEELAGRDSLYLITDGHKLVQAKKIKALHIAPLFDGVYITHRYGRSAAKPSPRCFELIRQRENSEWTNMVYVGDDPSKDFVTLNQLGMPTVRILTGRHAEEIAAPGFDATRTVRRLRELPAILDVTRSASQPL